MPWDDLQCFIVAFPDYTHLLSIKVLHLTYVNFYPDTSFNISKFHYHSIEYQDTSINISQFIYQAME